jgi:16S rRNA (uracil1498-N3)-methyltransferase
MSLREALGSVQRPPDEVSLLVGPEGGFTDAEREAIRGAAFLAVRLGDTTLRVETAAVALLAAVRALCGAD